LRQYKKQLMRNFVLFLAFSLSTFLSFSQYIEGKVLDATTNEPIEGVSVFMKGVNRGTITDEKGNYYLKFPYKIVKNDIIRFSHIAYEDIEIPYVQKEKKYSVHLLVDLLKLEEVRISERRNLKQRISYKKLSSMKNGLISFGSLLKDGKIFVIGGDASYLRNGHIQNLEDFEHNMEIDNVKKFIERSRTNYFFQLYKKDILIYNIKTNSWEKKEHLDFRKRAHHNLNLYKNKIYALGGKRYSRSKKYEYLDDKIEVFDLETGNILIDDTNPHQAVDFASFTYKDNIIVMGGSTKMNRLGIKQYSNKVHLYDLKSGKWFQVGSMPIAKETRGVLIEDKIYLLGGFNKKPLSSVEVFNLKTQKWEKEGELFYGVSKPAITHRGNIIYFFNDGKINTYNVLTKELNEYLIELSLEASEMYYADNKLFILGGLRTNNFSQFPSRGLFSIDINEFDNTKIQNSKTL